MPAKSESPKQVVPVYLKPEQLEWLDQEAKRQDRTRGYIIRQVVAVQMAHQKTLEAG